MKNYQHLEAAAFILSEQQKANLGVKPHFNKCVDKAIELQNNYKSSEDLGEAKKYLQKALKLTNKNQYSKSWIYHNLGVLHYTSYLEMPSGVTESLKLALEYFRQALSYPERQALPHKMASTLTQIGNVYRRAAQDILFPVPRDECFDLSIQYHEKAISILSNGVPKNIASICRSEILLNLSSSYYDADRTQDACDALIFAFESFVEDFEFSRQWHVLVNYQPEQAFSIMYSRLDFFYEGDNKDKILNAILTVASELGLNTEKLKLMTPLADLSKPKDYILNLYRDAQETGKVDRIYQYLKDSMTKRQSAPTDQEADQAASMVQLAASTLARLKSAKGEVLESFSILEYYSAMRYTESAMQKWFDPDNALDFHLHNIKGALGAFYYFLNHNVLALEHSDDELRKQMLSEFVDKIDETSSRNPTNIYPYISDIKNFKNIIGACKSKDPINGLRVLANTYYKDIEKLNTKGVILNRYSEITPDHVLAVTNDFQDVVFLKIEISCDFKDFLVVVLNSASDGLYAKSVEVPVPAELIESLSNPSPESDVYNENWELDFIDWSELIPAGVKRVAILPSFWASFIPWVAVGKQGNRLLDSVDDVTWLPSILSLYHNNISYTERSDHFEYFGGDTAYSNSVPSNDVTKDQLIELISSKESFSYFGHAQQDDGRKASLKCGDYDINADELCNAVNGMRLVEVWACQSGKSTPDLFLGSPVNEPFGLDMTMLRFGADCAIGSLWSVPEFSTLHIKQYYDEQKASGLSASQALLAAQRWWLNAGVDAVISQLKENGVDAYLDSIGCAGRNAFDAVLGPIKNIAEKEERDLEILRAKLKHPYSWAAFRFCGLPEHKGIKRSPDYWDLDETQTSRLSKLISGLNLKSGVVEI